MQTTKCTISTSKQIKKPKDVHIQLNVCNKASMLQKKKLMVCQTIQPVKIDYIIYILYSVKSVTSHCINGFLIH